MSVPTELPVIQQCCTPLAAAPLGDADAARLASILKAVADPARLRLLSIIASHPDGEVCVCDLTEPLGLSQPTVSHHLKVMAGVGLVEREKRGVWAYYRMNTGALTALAGLFTSPATAGT
jgi:ArsR family transcriptional regulator